MVERYFSLVDRAYRAAAVWVKSHDCVTRFPPQRILHIGYRCGWHNGYRAALRTLKESRQ